VHTLASGAAQQASCALQCSVEANVGGAAYYIHLDQTVSSYAALYYAIITIYLSIASQSLLCRLLQVLLQRKILPFGTAARMRREYLQRLWAHLAVHSLFMRNSC